MTNDFQINPNFNTSNFDNSINSFNKVFSNSLRQTSNGFEDTSNFDEVFNSIGERLNSKTEPMKARTEYTADDTSAAIKTKNNLSPVAKLASDIGKGFSGGINELNDIQRKSEADIETFASGGDISIHEVMISTQKSQLAMQMAIQLRNQMITAYNEFKNMSI